MDDLSQSEYAQVEKGPSVAPNYLLHFLPSSLQDRITSQLPQEQRQVIEIKKNQLQNDLIHKMRDYVTELHDFAQKILDEHEIDTSKHVNAQSMDSDLALDATTLSSVSTDTISTQSDEAPEKRRKSSLVKKPRSGSSSSAEDSVVLKPKKRVSFNLEADVTYFSSDDEPDTFGESEDVDDLSPDEYEFDDTAGPQVNSITPAISSSGSDIEQIEDVTAADDEPIFMGTAGPRNERLITSPRHRQLMNSEEIRDMNKLGSISTTDRVDNAMNNEVKALRRDESSPKSKRSHGTADQDESNISSPLQSRRRDSFDSPDSPNIMQTPSDTDTSDDDEVFQFDESMMPNTGQSSSRPAELPADLDSGIASFLRSSVVDPALSMSLPSSGIIPPPNSSRSYFGSRIPRKYLTSYSPSPQEPGSRSESLSDHETGDSMESMHASSLPIDITIPQETIERRQESGEELSARYGTIFPDESYCSSSPDFELMSLSQKLKWEDEQMKKK